MQKFVAARFGGTHQLYKWIAFFVLGVISASCASPPPIRTLTPQEKVRYNNAVGSELSGRLEPALKIRQDAAIQGYLNRLAENLASTVPELRLAPLSVTLIQPGEERLWSSFGLPGNKLYISLALLKTLDFENEVAAVLAMELAHIVKGHAVEHYQRMLGNKGVPSNPNLDGLLLPQPGMLPESVDFFGPGGVFAFNESSRVAAADLATQMLYRAGYDPRGLITLLNHYKANPGRSPYEQSTLAKLLESVRRNIALYAPLRNPIVRSEAFLNVQKRMKQL